MIDKNRDPLSTRIWKESESLSGSGPFDTDAAWKQFKMKTGQGESPLVRMISGKKWIAYAAAIVAILITVFLLPVNEPDTLVYRSDELTAPLDLPDGSEVVLHDGKITLQSDFESGERKVWLDGSASFEVTHQDSRTFSVHFEAGLVQVVGTRFDIIKMNPGWKVQLHEGAIVFKDRDNPGKSLRVNPGESYFLEDGKVYQYFDDVVIGEVFNQLKKRFPEQLVILDPVKSSSCRITTAFQNEQLEEILSEIALILELQWERTSTGYLVSSASCQN